MKQVWIKLLMCSLVSNPIVTFCMDQQLATLLSNRSGRYLKSLSPEVAKSALDLIAALTANSTLQRAFLKTSSFKNKNFDLLIHQDWLNKELHRVRNALNSQLSQKFEYYDLQPKWYFKNDRNPVTNIWFSPDGKYLFSVESRNGVRGLCYRSLEELNNPRSNGNPHPNALINCSGCKSIRSRNARIVNPNGRGGTIQHSHLVPSLVSFSQDGRYLIASQGNSYEIWDMVSKKCTKKAQVNTTSQCPVAFSPDMRFIATYDLNQPHQTSYSIKFFDAVTGGCRKTLGEVGTGTRSICCSPDGQLLLTPDNSDKSLKIWNVNSGECVKTLRGHIYPIQYAQFSPNGQLIVSVSPAEECIKVWSVETGECIHTLKDIYAQVTAMALIFPLCIQSTTLKKKSCFMLFPPYIHYKYTVWRG